MARTSEHPQEYSVCTWLCGTHGGAAGQRRQTFQTRRPDRNWNASNRMRGCPLQEDLWRQAQGRRPQFRLLAAKYIHKTVRTDAGRAPFDWLLLMIKYWLDKKWTFDFIADNVGYAPKCGIAPLFACKEWYATLNGSLHFVL